MPARILLLLIFFLTAGLSYCQVPANAPAHWQQEKKQFQLLYDGQPILSARLADEGPAFYVRELKDTSGGCVTQVITITSVDGRPLQLSGTINGSGESFPCEENRGAGSSFVRHTVGLSHSLLNRAVYDRQRDWVLSVEQATPQIMPEEDSAGRHRFHLTVQGDEICLRFQPRYYQYHRGLRYFEPWTYEVWQKSVAGWCSWYAYGREVDEQKVKTVTDVLSETLKPYGLEYVQIDDGYQQATSTPDKWTQANDHFPSGLPALSAYIRAKGLKPGIWTNVSFSDKAFAYDHKSLFVTDDQGNPAWGRWVQYILDGSNPATLEQLIRPIYRRFRESGWQYYKLDALRHLRYEGYNSHAAYFHSKGVDRVEAFRNVVKTVRAEIGRDHFLLACWGIRPELIGLVDGCRIGDDGFGLRTLTQYNSFNNIVWRNDPDHIELSPGKAFRDCMVTSLTGSVFMLTDQPGQYRSVYAEAARRSLPVPFTVPGQLYDVDPSRSMYLGEVGTQLSGSGPRIFDARNQSPYSHFLLEISKSYEDWLLLGRVDESRKHFSFRELGLDPAKEYQVFEFWSKKYLGSFREGFDPGPLDSFYHCQLFCVREKKARPQFLASNRHITCGGLELEDLRWEPGKLEGQSEVLANEDYRIYLTEPEGYQLKEVRCPGARLLENKKEGSVRILVFRSSTAQRISWSIYY